MFRRMCNTSSTGLSLSELSDFSYSMLLSDSGSNILRETGSIRAEPRFRANHWLNFRNHGFHHVAD
jgi:hypothetical protein